MARIMHTVKVNTRIMHTVKLNTRKHQKALVDNLKMENMGGNKSRKTERETKKRGTLIHMIRDRSKPDLAGSQIRLVHLYIRLHQPGIRIGISLYIRYI